GRSKAAVVKLIIILSGEFLPDGIRCQPLHAVTDTDSAYKWQRKMSEHVLVKKFHKMCVCRRIWNKNRQSADFLPSDSEAERAKLKVCKERELRVGR
ncbi:MAG: hypothetical protein ACRCYJ_12770, partial [Plesiomonas shigelloides]